MNCRSFKKLLMLYRFFSNDQFVYKSVYVSISWSQSQLFDQLFTVHLVTLAVDELVSRSVT